MTRRDPISAGERKLILVCIVINALLLMLDLNFIFALISSKSSMDQIDSAMLAEEA